MKNILFLSFLFFLFAIPSAFAPGVNIPAAPINYSLMGVNDSYWLRSLSPQQVANLFIETDPIHTAWLTTFVYNHNQTTPAINYADAHFILQNGSTSNLTLRNINSLGGGIDFFNSSGSKTLNIDENANLLGYNSLAAMGLLVTYNPTTPTVEWLNYPITKGWIAEWVTTGNMLEFKTFGAFGSPFVKVPGFQIEKINITRIAVAGLVFNNTVLNEGYIFAFDNGGVGKQFVINGFTNTLDLGSGDLATTGAVLTGSIDATEINTTTLNIGSNLDLVTYNLTTGFIKLNQTSDNKGIEICGYDDRRGKCINMSVDSDGEVRILPSAGIVWFGAGSTKVVFSTTAGYGFNDGKIIYAGTTSATNAGFLLSTTQTPDAPIMFVSDTGSRSWIVADKSDVSYDWSIPAQSAPALCFVPATQAQNQRACMFHDGTNFNINISNTAGNGALRVTNSSGLGAVYAEEFLTSSSVPDVKSGKSYLKSLENIDKWMNLDGTMNYAEIPKSMQSSVTETDYSRPEKHQVLINVCDDSEGEVAVPINCRIELQEETYYPHTYEKPVLTLEGRIANLEGMLNEAYGIIKELNATIQTLKK